MALSRRAWCLMYQPGELDQTINLYRWVYSDDCQGGRDKIQEALFLGLPAKQRPMTGNESDKYDKLNANGTDVFVIRYTNELNESDLIEWNGEKFNIRYLKNHGNHSMYLEIFAEYGWPT